MAKDLSESIFIYCLTLKVKYRPLVLIFEIDNCLLDSTIVITFFYMRVKTTCNKLFLYGFRF